MIESKEFLCSLNSKILATCLFPGFGWHWPIVPNAAIGTRRYVFVFLCFCISNFCPGVDVPGLWWALADGLGGSDGQQRFTPARPLSSYTFRSRPLPAMRLEYLPNFTNIFCSLDKFTLQLEQIYQWFTG